MPRVEINLDNIPQVNLTYFLNALQLCLSTKIHGVIFEQPEELQLKFSEDPQTDKSYQYFKKLMDSQWNSENKILTIKNWNQKISQSLISFLMLSRLQKENMIALVKLDPQYQIFVEKILGNSQKISRATLTPINSIGEASQFIFSQVQKQALTLRELSEHCSLSQVALSHFKMGKDIRLSSLLKILNALRLKLSITE